MIEKNNKWRYKMSKYALKENKIVKIDEASYDDDLNTIAEPQADKEIKKILSADEYNTFFKELEKIDDLVDKSGKAEDAMEILDFYSPMNNLKEVIKYVEKYMKLFNTSKFPKFVEIFNKLKQSK